MSFLIKNLTGAPIDIDDLGIQVPAGTGSPTTSGSPDSGIFDLTTENPRDITLSTDLTAQIDAGNIIILNPFDNVELPQEVSSNLIRVNNDPTYPFRPDNVVVVNTESDLPAASGSPSAHYLDADTCYFITGKDIVLDYPLIANGSVAFQGLWGYGGVQLTYNGSDTFLTVHDGLLELRNLRIDVPNGQFLYKETDIITPSDYFGGVRMVGFLLDRCAFLGHIHNSIIDANDCALGYVSGGQGFHIHADNPAFGILSFRQVNFGGLLDGATAINLDDSVFSTIELRDCIFRAPYGGQATAIAGVVDSENVLAGTIAEISSCEFGAGGSPLDIIPLENITVNDVRWNFQNNSNVPDTFPRVLISTSNNITPTIIAAPNTPVPVAGIWTLQLASQFSKYGSPVEIESDGTALVYIGEREIQVLIDMSVGVQAEGGGGTHDIRFSIWKNGAPYYGSPDTNAGTLVVTSVSPTNTGRKNVVLQWIDTFVNGDYIELYIENLENDSNYVINNGIIRLTSKS